MCTKCFIDKPSTEYQSYWHSTQQTTRTRKVCNSCYNEQKKQYRLNKKMLAKLTIDPDILYKDNPNYRKCNSCNEWKPKDYYYKYKSKMFAKCIDCERIVRRKVAEDKKIEQGGSIRIKNHPNQYVDEYQRDSVFKIMLAIGYQFNEEKGIWFKEPWKTRDGEFPLLKSNKKVKTIICEDVKERIIELKKTNKTIAEISDNFNLSYTSVWKICRNI